MTTSHTRVSVGTGSLRPAVVPIPAGSRRRAAPARESTWRHARVAEALEDRMRLVAALLVLATLLLWILFLQG